MALFGIRKSFRPSPEELPLALQELLGEVKEEKAQLEVVLERVRNAAQPTNKVDKRLGEVSRRQDEIAAGMEAAATTAGAVSELAEQVARARSTVVDLEEGNAQAGADMA